jgi:uncharacterized membrane protein YkvA (DUF1232 family)
MPKFTKEQIATALSTKSEPLSPDDVRRVAKSKEAVLKMISEFPEEEELAKRRAHLLFEMIEACSTGKLHLHPDELKWAAGALIYLGAPFDIVPDHEEGGYADDAEVIALAIEKSEEQVRAYCKLKEVDPSTFLG